MVKNTKLILLNAGTRTEAQMSETLTSLQLERYRSKDIYILVDDGVSLYSKNTPISPKGAVVFNRFYRFPQFTGLLLEHFKHSGSEIVNPIQSSYHNASEKSAQMVRSGAHGIPVPKSIVTTIHCAQENSTHVLSHISFPLIFKTDGMKGEHVHLCKNMTELETVASQYEVETVCILQEYIESNFDIRIIMAFGECIGAIRRSSSGDTFKHNVSLGGSVEMYSPSTQEIAIAEKALEVNQTNIAGVDIMYDGEKPVFLELNHGFGVEGFESVHTDIKVAEKIAQIIETKYAD